MRTVSQILGDRWAEDFLLNRRPVRLFSREKPHDVTLLVVEVTDGRAIARGSVRLDAYLADDMGFRMKSKDVIRGATGLPVNGRIVEPWLEYEVKFSGDSRAKWAGDVLMLDVSDESVVVDRRRTDS